MKIVKNPYRGTGIALKGARALSSDPSAPMALIQNCPQYQPTPLIEIEGMTIKDERPRMGLGSFKATGAAYVIAAMAQSAPIDDKVFVTASAGNHGLSVAAGARVFGAKSVIYLSNQVPKSFAQRLRKEGAQVVIHGDDYQESMDAAMRAANDNGWILLSDSSWEGYIEHPHKLMEGYLVLGAEIASEGAEAPTHIFLQAGVGGLAGAMTSFARREWGDAPIIIVVEPDEAPALQESIEAGALITSKGGISSMGRLDCKTPSLIALAGLSHDADFFLTLSDQTVEAQLPRLATLGLETSPSGGAGLASFLSLSESEKAELGMSATSRPLFVLSEGAA